MSTGSARGDVHRVASDPELGEAVGDGEGEEQAAGSVGEMVAAEGGVELVADIAGVGFDVEIVLGAEANGSGDGFADLHFEVMGGDALVRGVGVYGFGKMESEFGVGERPTARKQKAGRVSATMLRIVQAVERG